MTAKTRQRALLRRAPILRRLSAERFASLLSAASEREFETEAVLFAEGEKGGPVYVLLAGYVRLTKEVLAGAPVRIATRGPGDLLGEVGFGAGSPRSATACAESRVRVLEIPRRSLKAALRAEPEAALDLARFVAERLREGDAALVDSVRKSTSDLVAANDRLGSELRRLRQDEGEASGFREWVGRSREAHDARRTAARAATSLWPVLLVGGRGTGKRHLAEIVHARGPRAAAPFRVLEASLFPAETSEAFLFGSARGAPAGSASPQTGLVSASDGGTLYIEDVDRLSLGAQAQLVRLQTFGEYQRVGAGRVRTASVRLIASLADDPEQAVALGTLRSDLASLLGRIAIRLSALRHRRQDIAPIALDLAKRRADEAGVPVLRFSVACWRALALAELAGNGDELRSEIDRLYDVLGPGATVGPGDLAAGIFPGTSGDAVRYGEAVRAFKSQLIGEAFRAAEGNVARAAERLALHPSNLHRMMRDLRIPRG
jgi:DNA-binding NtrC family response regulator